MESRRQEKVNMSSSKQTQSSSSTSSPGAPPAHAFAQPKSLPQTFQEQPPGTKAYLIQADGKRQYLGQKK
jgi:hypothetical protein